MENMSFNFKRGDFLVTSGLLMNKTVGCKDVDLGKRFPVARQGFM